MLVEGNSNFMGFMTDDDYNIRFGLVKTPEGGQEMLKPLENGSWEKFISIGPDNALTVRPASFDKSGKILYLISSWAETQRLLPPSTSQVVNAPHPKERGHSPQINKELIIAENLRADISEVMSHPVKKDIGAAAFTYDRKQWKTLNISVALDRDYLGAVADGEINVVDRALDDRHWIVVCLLDNGPVRYYHYDRDAEKATFLFSHMSKREGLSLAKMHPVIITVIIKSRDGLNLVSHYSPPVWSADDGSSSNIGNNSTEGIVPPVQWSHFQQCSWPTEAPGPGTDGGLQL